MTGLDTVLEPDERVTGRWEGSLRPAIVMLLALYGVLVLLGWGIGHFAIPSESAFRHALALFAFLGPLPILAAGFALLEDFGRGPAVLLTESRLLWKEGMPAVRRELNREDIASVTAYETSGVIHLELADGSVVRIGRLTDPLSLAGSLGRPGRLWRRPHTLAEERWYRTFVAVAAGTTSAVTYILMSVLFYQVFSAKWGVWPLPVWLNLSLSVLAGIAFMLGANVLAIGIAPHFIASRRLGSDALRRFACRRLCRRCAGREPAPEGGGGPWNRIEAAIDDWLMRRCHGGTLECACEPEIIGPETG